MYKIYGGILKIFVLVSFFKIALAFSPMNYTSCNAKDFGHGFVCVCSEQYCDHFDDSGSHSPLKDGQYAVYTSSKAGARFNLTLGVFNDQLLGDEDGVVTLTVNESVLYQSILGFGGAFTGTFIHDVKS